MAYKQAHPLASFRIIVFHLSTSAGAALTGQTFSTTDLQIAKPGDTSYANCNSTQQSAVVELGGGDYAYTFTTTELGTTGIGGAFKVAKSGAVAVTYSFDVDPAFFATVQTGTLTATAFTTNRTETTDDYWEDALIVALSGSLIGQVKKIGAYTGSSKTVTLAGTLTFTGAPSNGDVFELLVR